MHISSYPVIKFMFILSKHIYSLKLSTEVLASIGEDSGSLLSATGKLLSMSKFPGPGSNCNFHFVSSPFGHLNPTTQTFGNINSNIFGTISPRNVKRATRRPTRKPKRMTGSSIIADTSVRAKETLKVRLRVYSYTNINVTGPVTNFRIRGHTNGMFHLPLFDTTTFRSLRN